MRLALLTEIPAPYRIPLFNALAAIPGIELHVFFLSRRDPRRPYPVYADEFEFEWRVLEGRGLSRNGRWTVFNLGVVRELVRLRPAAIIVGGWNQPAFWEAVAWALVRRRPFIVWVESTRRDTRSARRLARAAKGAFLRRAAGTIVPGRAAAEYVRSIDAAAARVTLAPNAIDLGIFGDRVAALRRRRVQLRDELGVDGCVLLYAGRLAPEKGLDVLLDALPAAGALLVLAGSGPEEARLRRLASERVRFLGQLTRDELVAWYAAADVFVLPSRSEPWGMVLSEAATAALPLVATDAVGAAPELIRHGENGFVVPAGDREALASALARLVGDEDLRRRAGPRSAELAQALTPERWAAAVAGLVRSVASLS